MNKYGFWMLIAGLSFSGTLFAHPASTEYVNQQINHIADNFTASLNSEINKLVTRINRQRIKTHEVGEHYQGGIIFFVDESKMHGLIAAKNDANNGEGIQWKNGESGEKIVNARANGFKGGESNTRLIIAQQTIDYQEGNFAALAAANYSAGDDGAPCETQANHLATCYGDWYLPSIYELDLMAKSALLSSAFYWSSTEANVTESWAQEGGTRAQMLIDKSISTPHVRAIRAF